MKNAAKKTVAVRIQTWITRLTPRCTNHLN
jgi:hypothetical protein